MSRRHQMKNTDTNEKDIVKTLKKIPGVTVETGHDDLLVGFRKRTWWFEVKNPDEVNKEGMPYKKDNNTYRKQKKIYDEFTGQYHFVTTADEIMTIIGVTC